MNVVAADTDVEAEYLATSLKQFFMGVITGKRRLLQPPVESMASIWNVYEEEAIMQMLSCAFIGGPATLKRELETFVQQTQVDEIMVTSHIFDHDAKMHSYTLFAEALRQGQLVSV